MQFERDRKLYQIKRKCYANKKGAGLVQYSPAKLFMLVAAEDGRWYPPIEPPEDIIAGILPVSLHQYFFFDGERIDRFFRARKNNNIAEDTKELLGVKVLERAIEHLKTAKRTLQEELQTLSDPRIKQLLKNQIQLEQENELLHTKQEEILREIKQLEEQKQTLNSQLLDVNGADKLQARKTE